MPAFVGDTYLLITVVCPSEIWLVLQNKDSNGSTPTDIFVFSTRSLDVFIGLYKPTSHVTAQEREESSPCTKIKQTKSQSMCFLFINECNFLTFYHTQVDCKQFLTRTTTATRPARVFPSIWAFNSCNMYGLVGRLNDRFWSPFRFLNHFTRFKSPFYVREFTWTCLDETASCRDVKGLLNFFQNFYKKERKEKVKTYIALTNIKNVEQNDSQWFIISLDLWKSGQTFLHSGDDRLFCAADVLFTVFTPVQTLIALSEMINDQGAIAHHVYSAASGIIATYSTFIFKV